MKRSMIRKVNNPITITAVLTALMSSTGFILASSPVSATSSSASATVHVPDACTLVSTLNTPHTATLSPGTSTGYGNAGGVNGIGQTTLKVTCNDSLGFAIYAIGYTEDTFGNTNLVSNTKTNGTSTYTIATGTNTSGANSNWAMQINAVSGSFAPTVENSFDSSSYHNVPTTYTMVAKRTSATMNPSDPSTSTTGSSITTTYAAYISTEQAPDTYTGKVKYTMVHPNNANSPVQPLAPTDCPANSICYAPNADDIVGSMDSISNTKIAKSATAGVQTTLGHSSTSITSNSEPSLIAPNYSRAGYGFAGWSTDYDAASTYNNDHNADITIFGPNQTITTSTSGTGDADVSTNGLILYPVWIASAGNIQSWTGCSNLTTAPIATKATLSSVAALTDQRDGSVYTVARLADGNCWMSENLRIDAEATRGSTNQALAQGYGDDTTNNRGQFIGLPDSENSNFVNNTNANSIYYGSRQSGTASVSIGGTDYPAYRIPRYNNNNTNRSLTASYNGTGNSTYYQWYGYGNYYNWPAAIANTTYNNTNNTSTDTTSICPTGWRLPHGGQTTVNTTAEFYLLGKAIMGQEPDQYASGGYGRYGNSVTNTAGDTATKAFRKFPNNFVYSGRFSGSSAANRSSIGSYWSSTVDDNYYSYYLSLYSSYVYPGSSTDYKHYAWSIRCLTGS